MTIKNQSYFFEPKKIIKDLVHEYINLTLFDLDLIDTIEFQRLKDVRQLTCQHVYPAARHTRFEHSLGVLELTRQAIKYLNKNGFIDGDKPSEITDTELIDDDLRLNAGIAALLHDVGHCPFSHLGETEFDRETVRLYLYSKIQEYSCDKDLIKKIGKDNAQNIGSVHEQLSCIIILEKYSSFLNSLSTKLDEEITIDYDLIIRSILGIEYEIFSKDIDLNLVNRKPIKNAIIRLINSGIFDMDKLDYIIRDSFFTGIGTPSIDTQRLFKNMFFNRNYELTFTRKAIPVLQNMIDSRDGLYMYVYNHHAVILSDFINAYISRHLSHNSKKFACIVEYGESGDTINKKPSEEHYIPKLGLVSKERIFSINSIVNEHRSDSDWISMLNEIDLNYTTNEQDIRLLLEKQIKKIISDNEKTTKIIKNSDKTISDLADKIKTVYTLIHNLKVRTCLKPWWKTVFEFKNFINLHFPDDRIRKDICKYVCSNGSKGLKASEFRSQIAKHVIYITEAMYEDENPLLEPLNPGDFFIVERSNRFLGLDAIEKLEIALKENEIIGSPNDANYKTKQYYIKNLTNIIPQKDYKSIYSKEGFYIFSKPYIQTEQDKNDDYISQKIKKHYKFIEQIFVFVVSEFAYNGEEHFVKLFGPTVSDAKRQKNEQESKEKMLEKFKNELFGK